MMRHDNSFQVSMFLRNSIYFSEFILYFIFDILMETEETGILTIKIFTQLYLL
jgi:hypothetical protein